MAFKLAGALAFRSGAEKANPVLLEPVMNVEVTTPAEVTGDIIGDLNSRRGRIVGMEPAGETAVVRAQAPMAEMLTYESTLRSLTGGRGADLTFECTGTQPALTACGETTRMSGTIAIVGFHQGAARQLPLAHWNWMAFSIVNAHVRDVEVIMRGMDVGMRLVSSGVLSMDDLVTHRFALEEIDDAFATLRAKPDGFCKAVITFP
jgi:threonine dehydrogenase-like Zn-dependent dehydrogenase